MAGIYDFEDNPQVPFRSPQVPAPTPVAGAPSVPVREVGGQIVPAADTSGLYAIYGRPNPARVKEQRFSSMIGTDMGGRLGQLPGVAAAIRAAIEGRKADAIDAKKEQDIKNFLDRKEAYDKIKNDRETRAANSKYLTETIYPAAQQEYAKVLTETKDLKAASDSAAMVINKMASDQGIPVPEVVAFNAWKGAASMSVISEKGEKSTAIYKDGAMLVQNKKGDYEPPTERWLNLKDAADYVRGSRPAGGSDPRGMLEFYDDNGNLVAKTKDQNEALRAGATKVGRWVRTIDDFGVERWTQEMVPLSKAPVKPVGNLGNTQVNGQPPAPAAAQQVATQMGRPNFVPGSPGSGQAQPAPAPQAQPAAASQQTVMMAKPGQPPRPIYANKIKDAEAQGYRLVN